MKMPGQSLFVLQAHSKATSCIDWNPYIPECLLTASVDKTVKMWDVANGEANCVVSREPAVGKIFSASFYADAPLLVAVAGSKGEVKMIKFGDIPVVCETFQARLNGLDLGGKYFSSI